MHTKQFKKNETKFQEETHLAWPGWLASLGWPEMETRLVDQIRGQRIRPPRGLWKTLALVLAFALALVTTLALPSTVWGNAS